MLIFLTYVYHSLTEIYKDWEPYQASSYRLGSWRIDSGRGFTGLLHIVGAFGLCVIFVFGVYRLCQVLYRRSFPYESLSSTLTDHQHIARAKSVSNKCSSNKFITVENDDMIALMTVSHKEATTPREKVLGFGSNKSPSSYQQNSSGNVQDGFSLRRSRG